MCKGLARASRHQAGETVKSWQGNLLVHWSEYFSQFYDYYYGLNYNYDDYYFDVCMLAKWGDPYGFCKHQFKLNLFYIQVYYF